MPRTHTQGGQDMRSGQLPGRYLRVRQLRSWCFSTPRPTRASRRVAGERCEPFWLCGRHAVCTPVPAALPSTRQGTWARLCRYGTTLAPARSARSVSQGELVDGAEAAVGSKELHATPSKSALVTSPCHPAPTHRPPTSLPRRTVKSGPVVLVLAAQQAISLSHTAVRAKNNHQRAHDKSWQAEWQAPNHAI